jgi:hypothetical protein
MRITADDRGVAAVEAAIVTPVFILVLLGIIEYGLVFKDQLAITSAVRAGARMASAEPRQATFATDAAAQVAREGSALNLGNAKSLWIYQADPSGHPLGSGGSFSSCATNCDIFAWNGSTFVQTAGSWNPLSQNACQGTQDSVGIYLSFTHSGVTKVFFSSIQLSSYTVMRFEPIPALQGGGCR